MNYLKLLWHRLSRWEYWPFWVIYYPLFPIWIYLALRARSFFFFNAANPKIKNGGMAMESKMDIYRMIPPKYIPKTLHVKKDASLEGIMQRIDGAGICFPFIAKPDVGMKAFGVERIHDKVQLQGYLKKAAADFLVQELVTHPNEVGVFYVRKPGEDQGTITSIVAKEFLKVLGNGVHSIEQLVKQNPRSYRQLKMLRKRLGDELQTVLPKGEEYVLVPFGSHTRGARFVDHTAKSNQGLTQVINAICSEIPEFHYGRLDILFNTFDDLSNGLNFKVIEVNGAGSEPTHIYDPKHSLWYGWSEIVRHWNWLCTISIANKKRGYSYLSFKDGRAMLKANNELEAQLKLI